MYGVRRRHRIWNSWKDLCWVAAKHSGSQHHHMEQTVQPKSFEAALTNTDSESSMIRQCPINSPHSTVTNCKSDAKQQWKLEHYGNLNIMFISNLMLWRKKVFCLMTYGRSRIDCQKCQLYWTVLLILTEKENDKEYNKFEWPRSYVFQRNWTN